MSSTESALRSFKAELIRQSGDADFHMSARERAVLALLSVPIAAQKQCSKDELREIIATVTRAIEAHHQQEKK